MIINETAESKELNKEAEEIQEPEEVPNAVKPYETLKRKRKEL